ncbi:hypothetical protein CK203_029078 [Vitis vinifera]|uniref:Uncharacterized protein n=1 Tax=Vitis vinifera TaxID=29760 RepID=A0A438IN10_VITVI|nr:hypothetical protein CK203_029078 [Vitis vinifera]
MKKLEPLEEDHSKLKANFAGLRNLVCLRNFAAIFQTFSEDFSSEDERLGFSSLGAKVINFVDYSLNQGAPAGHESAKTPIRHESNGAVAGDRTLNQMVPLPLPLLGTNHVATPNYELQPSYTFMLNIAKSHIADGEEKPEGDVIPLSDFIIAPTNRRVRKYRVRRMAPNLLSPFISQPQTRQSTIRMDLKEVVALVFGGDLDASEELVAMHDTSLTRGNLGCFEGNGWIGNDVHMTSYHSI